jgi:hypothetical protein
MNASRITTADRFALVFLTEDGQEIPCVAGGAFSLQTYVELLKQQGLIPPNYRAIGVFRGLELVDVYESDRPIGELGLCDGDRVLVGEADEGAQHRPSIATYEFCMAASRAGWRAAVAEYHAAASGRSR